MKLKKIRATQRAASAAHRTAKTDAERAYWQQQYNAALDAEDERSLVKSSAWVEDDAQARLERARDRSSTCADTKIKQAPGKRGPKKGRIDRFGDRALYPEIDKLCSKGLTDRQAASKLYGEGKLLGVGQEESRVRRIVNRYRADRGN